MNKQLAQLSKIIKKPSRKILGLMSGTSLDGLDIALCECEEAKIAVTNFKTIEYNAPLRARIRAIQSKQTVDLQELCVLNTELALLYGEWILEALEEWGKSSGEVDLIASHGQTIYHQPAEDFNSTLQIVDGDHIAQQTGIITISDFRQKHTAAGGEGAPLVALMDEKLFRHQAKHRILLNLGGIANFTWLPSLNSAEEIITSDTGPANTLINEAMQKHFNKPYDANGGVAKEGMVHSELLKYILLEPYFRKPFPKTTGQEDFNLELVEELMKGYQIELTATDLIATLTQLTVQSISRAFDKIVGEGGFELYASGGGIHNNTLMESLKERLSNAEVKNFEELGMHPDAKEAALMAFLADELLQGKSFDVNGVQVGLGKICLPN